MYYTEDVAEAAAGEERERKEKEELQGRALQVYLYLRRRRGGEPAGIREIQRELGLSSPSVAEYQVDKLEGMGLVCRDNYGRVCIADKKRKVRAKELQSHVALGRFFVPRLAFYASIFSAVTVLYVLFSFDSLSAYGVVVPAAAAAVLWLEAHRMWRASREFASAVARARKAEGGEGENESILPLLVPGLVALAVFAGTGAFLFQYQQQQAAVPQVQLQVPAPSGYASTGPTLEESVELSRQKVAAAGGPQQAPGITVATAMPLAGALVVSFMAYLLLVRYRAGSVLKAEQGRGVLFGTQDYPERLP